jgi:hypothetical protein
LSFKIFAADLPNGRGNFFLSSLRGIILAFLQNAQNGRKKQETFSYNMLSRKAWQRLLISCLGVPSYVTAVIQFFGMAVRQSGT